jgi:FKBP-type peptidyl-prolyl cis-trans isomerase 2
MKKLFSIILLFILTLTITSCMKQEQIVKAWDRVLVHYNWTFPDGEKFDSSYDRGSPIEFTVLNDEMISWFDNAVVWMKVWDKKSITLTPTEAYGERDESNIIVLEKSELKDFEDAGIVLEAGAILPTMMWNFSVISVDDSTVTIDGNHQMAGKTLNFDIELVEIVKK